MAEFMARRVYEGKLEYDSVPEELKREVRQILRDKYDIFV